MPQSANQTQDADPADRAAAVTALVPLSDCYIHALNTRSEPPAAEIEALADSIAALGLLQNLCGWIDPAAPADSAWKTGIVAGGRRLRAMALLAAREGRDPAQTRVPVRLATDETTARIWASAENTARTALHPADEVRAYGRMAAQGAAPSAIARAFAVTERHVRQRLKLAALPGPVLGALREGRISLDQAAALTTANSAEAIEDELDRVLNSRWGISASDIRQRLQRASISAEDRRVALVGLDAYRAEGGALQEDLFTDQVRLLDEALLDEMVAEAMARALAEHRAEGWKWVELRPNSEAYYKATNTLQRIGRAAVDLPEADAAELDALLERAETEELTESDLARLDELEERQRGDWSDEDRATSGLYLFLEQDGTIGVNGPWRRPQDDPAAPRADETDTGGATVSRALPNNLIDDLGKIRLAALQIRAATQPELMLDLLAYQLSGEAARWSRALDITWAAADVTPTKPDGFAAPALFDAPPDSAAQISAEGYAAFRAKGKKHRNEVLARALARALLPVGDLPPSLAAQLSPGPRDIWAPTAAGYFARLPAAALDDIWTELMPEDRRDGLDFDTLKKAEKAKTLDRLFNDADYREALGLSREMIARIDAWLPAQMQWPDPEGGA